MKFSSVLIFLFFSLSVLRSQDPEVLKKLQSVDTNNPLVKSELKKMGISQGDIANLKNAESNSGESKQTRTQPKKVNPKENNDIKFVPVDSKDSTELADEVFGYHIFKTKVESFNMNDHVKASDDYIVGVGDEILVNIWGYSEFNGAFKVESDGAINPHLVGKVYVKELSFGSARQLIKRRFAKVYDLKNSDISIEISFSRNIRVNIVGEVRKPGTYSINANNSAFNALFAAGGLTKTGSLREVKVIREGKLINTIDIYKFLTKPESFTNLYLNDGDYVVVPFQNNLVEMSGALLRNGKFEFKEGESIEDIISYAGGYAPRAVKQRIHVERVSGNDLQLLEIKSDSTTKDFSKQPLVAGDKIIVKYIDEKVYGLVNVKGAVKIPGFYSFQEGDRISDVIKKTGGLKLESLDSRAYLIRNNNDRSKEHLPFDLSEVIADSSSSYNLPLHTFDEIVVFEKKDFHDDVYVSVQGSVRKPKKITYGKGLSLKDAIILSGGLKLEAANNKIQISRINNSQTEDDATVEIIEVKIDGQLNLESNGEVIELMPFDQVFVRKTPAYELQQNVKILGEVKYPGQYSLLNKKETLKSLIERAGGTTVWAFLEGATFVRTEDSAGIMILDLKALYEKNAVEYDYVLREGDVITIPRRSNFVRISGAIRYPEINEIETINAPFKRRRASHYINNYGMGYKKNAKKSSVYVLSAGGKVKRTLKVLGFPITPKVSVGDHIYVDYKVKKNNREIAEPINWNDAIENLTIKVTGVLTLLVLVQNAIN